MKRKISIGLFAVLAFVIAAGSLWVGRLSAESAQSPKDAPQTHVETFSYYTADQSAKQVTIHRRVLYIPLEYGKLAYVVAKDGGSILWFDNDETLRNISVPGQNVLIRRGVLYFDESSPE